MSDLPDDFETNIYRCSCGGDTRDHDPATVVEHLLGVSHEVAEDAIKQAEQESEET